MKVGVCLFNQNYADYNSEMHRGAILPDSPRDWQIVQEDLRFGDLVEGLGYDSLWAVEHHFTPYTMIPDPLQFLSYFAGRTSRIDLGTMVVVLPWHDPVRIAEQIALLDIMLNGRKYIMGFGRGTAMVEFNGLRIPMGEARERFVEAWDIIRLALTQERFSYNGVYYQIPEMSIRPQPLSKDLIDRAYMVWATPPSVRIAAEAGLGILRGPETGDFDQYLRDIETYQSIRASKGWAPKAPIFAGLAYCSDTADAIDQADYWMGRYGDSAIKHYQMDSPEVYRGVKGYEHRYEQLVAGRTPVHATAAQPGGAFEGLRRSGAFVAGNPDQCLARLQYLQERMGVSEFQLIFKYGGMPYEVAEKSLRLFAKEVLPAAHELAAPPAVADATAV